MIYSFTCYEQKRYKRLKKLKPIDSDEEDDDRASIGGQSADEREALAHELFEDDDTEQVPVCPGLFKNISVGGDGFAK